MALTAETLLEPVSEESPAGEDLSYDNDRSELEQVFETPENAGDEQAAEVDWRRVVQLIEGLFRRSKDVWLAAYLCRAGAKSGNLDLVEVGAETLAGLFEQYWETVHPTLDELGLPGRKAPCDALASRGAFLLPFENVILVAHPRLGRYSGADFERFRAGGAAEDGYGLFRAALEELPPEALVEAVERLKRIEASIRRTDAIFTREAAGDVSTNFSPTYELLAKLQRAVGEFIPGAEPEGTQSSDEISADGPVSKGASGPSLSGRVNSRDDVIRALDAAIDYYARSEPGSPIPLLLNRAKAWVPLDFLTILRDVAPEGIDQAIRVLNRRPLDED
jgi:type VI secretion system ImpA family protein